MTLVLEGKAEKAEERTGINVEAEGTARAKAKRYEMQSMQKKWEEASLWEQRVCVWEGRVGSRRAWQSGPAQSGSRAR